MFSSILHHVITFVFSFTWEKLRKRVFWGFGVEIGYASAATYNQINLEFQQCV